MNAKKHLAAVTEETLDVSLLLDRELSQLAFNRRVLAQAEDPGIPLLERLRYLCIVGSNLDEFFEVRIASLLARQRMESMPIDLPVHDPELERMGAECHQIVSEQYAVLNKEILPELAREGIFLLRHEDHNEAQRAWVKDYSSSANVPVAHADQPAPGAPCRC